MTTNPSTFVLRPFQVEDVAWLRATKRGLVTHAPGLGKTAVSAYAADTPVLVVCPNYLTVMWYQWLTSTDEASLIRNNGNVVANVSGTVALARGTFADKLSTLRSEADWVVINVEALGTHSSFMVDLAVRNWWSTIIFDESHHLRSHTAKRSRVAVQLARVTPRVYCLTATPIWKEVDDLFNQLQIIHPTLFTSYTHFVNLFCVADKTRFGTKVLGIKKRMLPELEEILSQVRIGRTYAEAGRQLPDMIEKFIKVELPPSLRRNYDQLVTYWRTKLSGGDASSLDDSNSIFLDNFSQVLNTLRLIARWPGKYEAASDIVAEALHGQTALSNVQYAAELTKPRSSNRIVVFTWFQDTAETAAREFNALPNVHAVAITGKLKIDERRAQALNKHNNVICATIASLSEGIDLSDARTVIFLEEYWTPGSTYQALSRVRRERNLESNEEPVLVYYVQSANTIDEHIHTVNQRRSGTAKELLKETLGL